MLPAELAQGLFAAPGEHRCLIRLSTNTGDILPAAISLPRGLAMGRSAARVGLGRGDAVLDLDGLAAHQPLGNINRARKETYEHAAQFRSRTNGCPIHEPQ